MESNTTTTTTIAQLWGEFDGLIRLSIPHLTKLASPAYNVDAALRPEYEQQLKQCNERLAELRDQLIELCEKDYAIEIREVKSMKEGIVHKVFCSERGRIYFTEDESRDYGAAWMFMAWELEQRQKGQATT
jgi:hypothetical protein